MHNCRFLSSGNNKNILEKGTRFENTWDDLPLEETPICQHGASMGRRGTLRYTMSRHVSPGLTGNNTSCTWKLMTGHLSCLDGCSEAERWKPSTSQSP
ncbi:hypothetical protein DPEC_G00201030 [Dallia pectoralis]|uniref:Uncharacterized protein n=1 Tax=Dallia pectoralis TaxID=75939 RepID=A0ACC2G9B9_DALPE|nr:hypothetical protein DPEC_G00201030 [Dallia pectoralis]